MEPAGRFKSPIYRTRQNLSEYNGTGKHLTCLTGQILSFTDMASTRPSLRTIMPAAARVALFP